MSSSLPTPTLHPDVYLDLRPGQEIYANVGEGRPVRRTVRRVYKHGRSLTVTRIESTVAAPGRHASWEVAERIESWQVVNADGVRLYTEEGARRLCGTRFTHRLVNGELTCTRPAGHPADYHREGTSAGLYATEIPATGEVSS